VSAKDKTTGKENNITIKANSGITEAEIQQMVADAEKYAEEDKKAKEIIEARNGVQAELYMIRKELTEHKDLATEEEWQAIEDAIKAAEELSTSSDDAEAIKKGPFNVADAAKPLFDKIKEKKANEKAANDAATAAAQNAAQAHADGEVIDASFTETKAS
jgi:molecular chaperone DnaK